MNGTGIAKALCAVKAKLAAGGGITKDRTAPAGAGGYNFRGIEDFDDVLCGMFAAEGIDMGPRLLSKEITHGTTAKGGYNCHVFLEYEWTFEAVSDGSKKIVSVMGEAMDTQDKACNKAIQASRKYALLTVLQIPTSGDDTEMHQVDAPAVRQQPVQQQAPAQDLPRGNLLPANGNGAAPGPVKATRGRAAASQQTAPQQPPPQQEPPPFQEPPFPNGSGGGSGTTDTLLNAINSASTFPSLHAMAGDADKYSNMDPARKDLFDAIRARCKFLFETADNVGTVQEGVPLVRALGNPDDLKKAGNEAYMRFRQ